MAAPPSETGGEGEEEKTMVSRWQGLLSSCGCPYLSTEWNHAAIFVERNGTSEYTLAFRCQRSRIGDSGNPGRTRWGDGDGDGGDDDMMMMTGDEEEEEEEDVKFEIKNIINA